MFFHRLFFKTRPSIVALVAILSTQIAFSAAPKWTTAATGSVSVTTPDGCEVNLKVANEPGSILVPEELADFSQLNLQDERDQALNERLKAVVGIVVNDMRGIVRNRFGKRNPIEILRLQEAEVDRLADRLSELVLSEEVFESEIGAIHIQQVLSGAFGAMPEGSMSSIEGVLQAHLGALEGADSTQTYKPQTNNALESITRELTQYRRTGLDINFMAKVADFFSWIPGIKGLSHTLITRFQTAKEAIDRNDQILLDELAHMRLRQQEMIRARLELVVFYRYQELSRRLAERLLSNANNYAAQAGFDDTQADKFQKHIQLPLTTAVNFVGRTQATIISGYHQFRLLMDGGLDLIVTLENIRRIARAEFSIFGAGKIIAREQTRTRNMAGALLQAVDDLRTQAVEEIRVNGVRQLEFTQKMIESNKGVMATIDLLLAQIDFGRQVRETTVQQIAVSNDAMKAKLEEVAERGGSIDLITGEVRTDRIDLIQESDRVNDGLARHRADEVTRMPASADAAAAGMPRP